MSKALEVLEPSDVDPVRVRPIWHYTLMFLASAAAIVGLGMLAGYGWNYSASVPTETSPVSVSDAPTTGKVDTLPELQAQIRALSPSLSDWTPDGAVTGTCDNIVALGPVVAEAALYEQWKSEYGHSAYDAAYAVLQYCAAK